jgi:hypothetical protein
VALTVRQVTRLVAMVDGLEVLLLDPASHALREDDAVLPGGWPFVRPAPGHWDLRRWEQERIRRPLKGCQAIVNPTWSNPPPASSTVKRARERSPIFPMSAMRDELRLRAGPQWVVLHDRSRSVTPPRRDGTFGQIVVIDGGIAMWSSFDDDQGAWVGVEGQYLRSSDTLNIHLVGSVGEMTFPSGVLRIAVTTEESYSDVMTRRATISVHVHPSMPNGLDVIVQRHEKQFDSPRR